MTTKYSGLSTTPISKTLPADGPHTLQIRLIDVDGKVVTFAIPIVLVSEVPNGAA